MGDRTYTRTNYKEDYHPLVLNKLGEDGNRDYAPGNADEVFFSETSKGNDVVEIIEYEANYGEMLWLEKVLLELKVPFDTQWEQGGGYDAGVKYVRFSETGETVTTEVYTSNDGKIEFLPIMRKIDQGKIITLEEVQNMFKEVDKRQTPYGGILEAADVPLRELSDEEKALIMQYKLEKAND